MQNHEKFVYAAVLSLVTLVSILTEKNKFFGEHGYYIAPDALKQQRHLSRACRYESEYMKLGALWSNSGDFLGDPKSLQVALESLFSN